MFESEEARDFVLMFLELSDSDEARLIEKPALFQRSLNYEEVCEHGEGIHNAMGKPSKEEI